MVKDFQNPKQEQNLTFQNCVSYIQDRHTATLQSMLFMYSVNKYN